MPWSIDKSKEYSSYLEESRLAFCSNLRNIKAILNHAATSRNPAYFDGELNMVIDKITKTGKGGEDLQLLVYKLAVAASHNKEREEDYLNIMSVWSHCCYINKKSTTASMDMHQVFIKNETKAPDFSSLNPWVALEWISLNPYLLIEQKDAISKECKEILNNPDNIEYAANFILKTYTRLTSALERRAYDSNRLQSDSTESIIDIRYLNSINKIFDSGCVDYFSKSPNLSVKSAPEKYLKEIYTLNARYIGRTYTPARLYHSREFGRGNRSIQSVAIKCGLVRILYSNNALFNSSETSYNKSKCHLIIQDPCSSLSDIVDVMHCDDIDSSMIQEINEKGMYIDALSKLSKAQAIKLAAMGVLIPDKNMRKEVKIAMASNAFSL